MPVKMVIPDLVKAVGSKRQRAEKISEKGGQKKAYNFEDKKSDIDRRKCSNKVDCVTQA